MDCKIQRRKLRNISKEKHRNPDGEKLREKYHKVLKSYKSLLETKKESFYNHKIQELITQKSKSTFWRTLRSADDSIRPEQSSSSAVPPEKWTEHFRMLHSNPNDADANLQSNFQNTLKNLENSSSTYHPILDKVIDYKDIVNFALAKLKHKKAASNDKIKNEMIKTSYPLLKESYRKPFNIILSSGIYPI